MKLTLILASVLCTAAWAQPGAGPGGPHQPDLSDLKAYLTLTDSQVQSLQGIQTQLMTATATTRQQIAQKQRDLRDQLAKGSTDATALGARTA